MKKSKPLTVRCFVSVGGAEPVDIETLNQSQMADINEKWSQRVGKALSEYYTAHNELYKKDMMELAAAGC